MPTVKWQWLCASWYLSARHLKNLSQWLIYYNIPLADANLVACYEGLPKAAPLLRRCDLIFSAERQTASLPLIHLAGGKFGLRQAGQPTDLWVESLAVLGRQAVGVGQRWGTNDWSNRDVISWHGGWIFASCPIRRHGWAKGQSR